MIKNDAQSTVTPAWGLARWQLTALAGLFFLLMLLLARTFWAGIQAPDDGLANEISRAALADLSQRRQSLALMGSLLANSYEQQITELRFVVALAPGAAPIDLTDPRFTLRYQDATQQVHKLDHSWRFQHSENDNNFLEEGEMVQIAVPLTNTLTQQLDTNTAFGLAVLFADQPLLTINRTTPEKLASFMDLN